MRTSDSTAQAYDGLLWLMLVLVGFGGFAGLALGHSNGHESRTAARCERLAGTEKAGERAPCLRCISALRPHPYHPDYPPGERCRPDNGKP